MAHLDSVSQLDAGLTFEDTGMLIPWGTPIKHLSSYEAPKLNQQANSIHYTWRNREAFGLCCDVSVCQIGNTPDPKTYHLSIPEFHWVSLRIAAEWGEQQGNLELGFRELFIHLESLFGAPTFCYAVYERGLPAFFWEIPSLQIGYSLMSGRPSISIAHEPDGYAELKSKYAAIRLEGGDGARIEYCEFDW